MKIFNIDNKPSKVIKLILSKLTRDVIYSLSNSLWRLISGPVTLIFIPLFISPVVQGYWFSFNSLGALAMLADLGFTTIVGQFSAHEFAHLRINSATRELEGDQLYLKRISSLFRFVLKWAFTVSMISIPIILSIGIYMFSNKSQNVNWLIPWIIFVMVSGINFTLSSVLSFLEGCNQVAEIQQNRIISTITATISTWVFLASGFDLYSLALTSLIGSILNVLLLIYKFKNIIAQLIQCKIVEKLNWRSDFLNLLWKYAISWSSGYFLFQIYTPLSFSFHGPIFAGKVGISMSLTLAMYSISYVWIYVSTPKFNMLASLKKWNSMDKLLSKTLILSIITFIIGIVFVSILFYFFADKIPMLSRFLGQIPITILFFAWFLQIPIGAIAVYLRAHKQEPMVWVSLAGAIFTAVSTYFLSKYASSDYLFLGIFIANLAILPVTIYILKSKRLAWH